MTHSFKRIFILSIILLANSIYTAIKIENEKDAKTGKHLNTLLKESTKPTIVEFHAEAWCGPCKFIGPKVVDLAQKHKGQVKMPLLVL